MKAVDLNTNQTYPYAILAAFVSCFTLSSEFLPKTYDQLISEYFRGMTDGEYSLIVPIDVFAYNIYKGFQIDREMKKFRNVCDRLSERFNCQIGYGVMDIGDREFFYVEQF